MRENYNDKQGLIELVDSLKQDDLIGIEIGSFAGESAKIFADTRHFKKLICIDIWRIEDHGFGNTYVNIADAEQAFDKVMAESDGKILKFKGTIDDFIASDMFKTVENKIDFVYIDALHTYEGCMHDIFQTMRVLKPSIAIAGHDFADFPEHIRGVKKAVIDYFVVPDATFCDTSWIKYLKT